MGDAGFFRGTSTDQDGRFPDKEKKLMKQLKFEEALSRKINMNKINLDVIKPWITAKINEILGMEDDVVVEFIMSQLETKAIDPKRMQINITGFLNARCARIFMGELWELLAEANESEDGIPKSLVDKKMAELKKEGNGEASDRKIIKEEAQGDWNKRYDKLSLGRYSGPTREKGVRDDRIVTSPPPRRRRERSKSRSRSPRRNGRDRSPERKRDSGRRREERSPDPEREAESKRREEERIKRHAEQRRREEDRRDRRDDDRRDRRRDDKRDKRRSDSRRSPKRRSRSPDSPVRRRFTEGDDRKRRSSVDSDENDKKKKRTRNESDSERQERKEKKEKKHKKEKKKKERKRTPTPSSSSAPDSE